MWPILRVLIISLATGNSYFPAKLGRQKEGKKATNYGCYVPSRFLLQVDSVSTTLYFWLRCYAIMLVLLRKYAKNKDSFVHGFADEPEHGLQTC